MTGTHRSQGPDRGQGPGGLLDTLVQSLQQLLGAQQTSSTGTNAGSTSDGSTSNGPAAIDAASATGSTASSTLRRDVQTFLHTLFQALQQSGGGSSTAGNGGTSGDTVTSAQNPVSGTPSAGSDSDGDNDGSGAARGGQRGHNLISGLQSLIQQLGGDSTTGNLSDVNAAFQTLVQDLSGSSSAGAQGSSAVDLKAFLQQFVQNLEQRRQASPIGVAVTTTA